MKIIYPLKNRKKIIHFVNNFPNAVLIKNDNNLPLVSNNLSIIKLQNNKIDIFTLFRTNIVDYEKFLNDYSELANKYGMDFKLGNENDMFNSSDGNLRYICREEYKKLFNSNPQDVDIHAGLEGGIFKNKIPELDEVVLGADLFNIHTPNEKMKISSLEKVHKWLLAILEKYNAI